MIKISFTGKRFDSGARKRDWPIWHDNVANGT